MVWGMPSRYTHESCISLRTMAGVGAIASGQRSLVHCGVACDVAVDGTPRTCQAAQHADFAGYSWLGTSGSTALLWAAALGMRCDPAGAGYGQSVAAGQAETLCEGVPAAH